MVIDYASVLMAVGAAGAALSFTLFSNWLKQRESRYLATWAVSMAIIIGTVITFALYSAGGSDIFGLTACVLLVWAFTVSLGATHDFVWGRHPTAVVAWVGSLASLVMVVPFAFGFDGVTFVLVNTISAVLIAMAAREFWTIRAESPFAIATIAVLHWVLGITFVLCALMIVTDTPLRLEGPPDNWAELLNLIACVIVITGVGGLIITVHQERIARAFRKAANTDSLTGVLNRRAVSDRFPDGKVPPETAMIVFDLDDFKGVNDRHGHSFGDLVLLRFAQLMGEAVKGGGLSARLGGEEFAVILPETGPHQAKALAEMVRLRFAHQRFPHADGMAACTVSAGIAVSGAEGCSLDSLMRSADAALYVSKRNGRNRVTADATSRVAA